MSDWSDEETDDPIYADRRNFCKVEKWRRAAGRDDALRRQQPRKSAPHLRANQQEPAAHPVDHAATDAGVERMPAARNDSLTAPAGSRRTSPSCPICSASSVTLLSSKPHISVQPVGCFVSHDSSLK
jgi:hypothetical protein